MSKGKTVQVKPAPPKPHASKTRLMTGLEYIERKERIRRQPPKGVVNPVMFHALRAAGYDRSPQALQREMH